MPDPSCGPITDDTVLIDIGEEAALATDIDAMIDRVADKLMAGKISPILRDEIAGMVARIPVNQGLLRAAEAIYLVATSPEYAYQQ